MRKLNNSKAEDDFAEMIQTKYALVEGEDFIREHRFNREFMDCRGDRFKIRVDFWFPRWRTVVEFKCGPLANAGKEVENARRAEKYFKTKGKSLRDILKVSWSNQFEKFRLVTNQANMDPETSDILWLLVDDNQMGSQQRYTYYGKPQRDRLRKKTIWNPMSRTEAGRLLYMHKAVEDLTPGDLWDDLGATGEVEPSLTGIKRQLLAELPSLDTSDGLFLVTGYGSKVVRDITGALYMVEELEARQIIKPPMH